MLKLLVGPWTPLSNKTLNTIRASQTQRGEQGKEGHRPYQVFTNSLLFPRVWPTFQLYFQMFQVGNEMPNRKSHLISTPLQQAFWSWLYSHITNLLASHFTGNPSDVSFPTDASNWQLCPSFHRAWPSVGRTRTCVARGWWVAVGICRQLEEQQALTEHLLTKSNLHPNSHHTLVIHPACAGGALTVCQAFF